MARELIISAELKQLVTVRSFVEESCRLMGVPDRITWALVLAVDEICSNIIRHGYRDTHGEIVVGVERTDDAIVVTLRDTSPAFSPVRSASDAPFRLARSGHGLAIANQVARLHYQPQSEHNPMNTTVISIPMG